jgi:hypothetical protein
MNGSANRLRACLKNSVVKTNDHMVTFLSSHAALPNRSLAALAV